MDSKNDKLNLFKVKEGKREVLKSVPYTFETNKVYKLKILVEESHIKGFLDDDLKFSVNDSALTSGYRGIRTAHDKAGIEKFIFQRL